LKIWLCFSYLDLCRKLQRTYYLEPAGSKGQWCLDDYQFLPFLWGSSQLTDDGPIEPKQATDERFYRDLANDYLYLSAIKYINEVKTGPFFEHSSTLYDISNVAQWSKVNQGMIKMYHGEVCLNLCLFIHFKFNSFYIGLR
jgi:serine/threonine-protein phosphatase 2A activator